MSDSVEKFVNDLCTYFDIYVFNKKRTQRSGMRQLRRAIAKEDKMEEERKA